MDELGSFGFSLGDLWDLEYVLQDLELKAANNTDDTSVLLSTKTPQAETDRQDDNEDPYKTDCTRNQEQASEHSGDSEEIDPECEKKILEYISGPEVLLEMTYYEKMNFFNRIKQYEFLKEKGFEGLQRPSYSTSVEVKGSIIRKKTKASTSKIVPKTVPSSSNRVLRKRKATSPPPDNNAEEDEHEIIGGKNFQPSSSKKIITLKRSFRQKNLLKQAIDSASSRDTIIAEHLAFLNSNDLTQVQKKIIKDFLECPSHPKFKVLEIVEGVEDTDELIEILNTVGYCSGEMFKFLIDILVDHLYSLHSDPNALLTVERESIAVSLVATFPKFAQRCVKEGEKPWSWLFDKASGRGKLANNVANRQRIQDTPRARNGGKRKAPQRKEKTPIAKRALVHSELSDESKYLACVSHIETNKETIIALAKQTFKERREFIMDEKYLLDSLLKEFKFFQAFKGEMIFLEFESMFPGKGDNLIRDGHQYIEKLLKLGYTEAAKFASVSNTTQNDCLNALMILVKYLPLPKRVYPHEKKMAVVAELDQIYQLVPVGSNVNLEISKRREAWKHPIQPYIMAMTNNDKVVSEYLVIGDGHSIQLQEQPTLKSIDLLLKTYYVFNVPYYLAWKNAFRFLAIQVLGLPKENPRLSDFTAQHVDLFNRF
ncbi:Hexosaminidase D [Frankliniella fusca]|uniref:Hexosaminidase D n=1 Tax=Frankliniella fusca TaxID=407009 RepID=A0AAE1LEY5_9NEOP|nr:Hexosaminidase D [Frankliniella fusca]KAK3917596.1 Hexosaminidase D [Frankliniella fusca]KAK3926563.1 Hexosaminidase D [Frankliniella fusca]